VENEENKTALAFSGRGRKKEMVRKGVKCSGQAFQTF
jgi:hypothetical protein